jgi:hypothetical protein
MSNNLMNFKLVLEQAEMELIVKSGSQIANSTEYEEAKITYERAARRYITELNDFCIEKQMQVYLDINIFDSNKYDH